MTRSNIGGNIYSLSGNAFTFLTGISAWDRFQSIRTDTLRSTNAGAITVNTGSIIVDRSSVTNNGFSTFALGMSGLVSSYGVYLDNRTNVVLSNNGSISTRSGDIAYNNAGTSSNPGTSSYGLFAATMYGNINLINEGTLNVSAGTITGYNGWSNAFGMSGVSYGRITPSDLNTGKITLLNTSDITVRGGTLNLSNPNANTEWVNIAAGMSAAPIVGISVGDLDRIVDKQIINSGAIDVSINNGNGIRAVNGIIASGNAGYVDIVNDGNITTSGSLDPNSYFGVFTSTDPYSPHPAGIYASTTNNQIRITNNGSINSYTESAISVRNISVDGVSCPDGGCSTTINNNGTLIGLGTSKATATIAIDPNREGNSALTTITNNGLITTQSGSLDNWAIAVGSPVNTTLRVINNGTIIGKWEQYQNGASVTNNSVWNTTGTNNFLGGQNSITNTAGSLIQSNGDTIVVMDGTGNTITNEGTIRTVGGNLVLDPPNNAVTVYNSGLIDMVNDGSSSVTNKVTVDGNFVASGNSTVAVNTQLGGVGSQSDRLMIAGNASGTNTNVIVRDTKSGVGAYNPFGTAIVGVAGTSTGSFTLSSASDHFAFRNGMSTLNKGLYFYYLGTGAGSTGCDNGYTCYSLYSAPSTAAKSLPIAVTAAQSLWQETALMWEDRQVELRDELTARDYTSEQDKGVSLANGQYHSAPQAKDGGISTWVKSVGAWTNRSNYQSQMGGGGNVLSYDLSYRQNSFGMLGGADWAKSGFITPNDYFVVGVMGGYLNSSVNFNREAGNLIGQESFSYTGGTIGASVSYMLNGFFADAMFKNDLLRSNMMVPVSGLTNSSTGVNTAGGIGNLGYRLNYGSAFFEPMATLTYSNTYMGGLNNLAAQGVNVSFGPGNDFRGGFGGRVGSTFANLIDKHAVELSLTGRYWNMFNSNAGRTATIVNENISDTIGDYTYGRSYGEIKGNVNVFALGSGISAFVNTGVRFNDHFQTVITKGGLAYRF